MHLAKLDLLISTVFEEILVKIRFENRTLKIWTFNCKAKDNTSCDCGKEDQTIKNSLE